jgi:hypothetical protein
MSNIKIFFDGFCPESMLKRKQVEMKLNEDDFWESEETGLQITVFPPYATILRWRGKGKFKQSSDIASNILTGLVLTEAQKDEGKEIFPDEQKIFKNEFEFEWYLDEIYKSKEEFDAAKFNPNDPVFDQQQLYLESLTKDDFEKLFQLYDELKDNGYEVKFMSSEPFTELHHILYELKLIFNFRWMPWHIGWEKINDTNFDYSNSTLLDLSMYLTAIFRADRFNDGTIELNFKNGTLDKIFNTLKLREK